MAINSRIRFFLSNFSVPKIASEASQPDAHEKKKKQKREEQLAEMERIRGKFQQNPLFVDLINKIINSDFAAFVRARTEEDKRNGRMKFAISNSSGQFAWISKYN
jgi:hypothetical protein